MEHKQTPMFCLGTKGMVCDFYVRDIEKTFKQD